MITTEHTSYGPRQRVVRHELIPDHVRKDIGNVGLEALTRFYQDQKNEDGFQEWLTGYRQRRAGKGGST